MKTTVKQLATGTLIALLLLVLNVKAEASNHKNNETALRLENWMMVETGLYTNFMDITGYVQETEAELELEGWMTKAEPQNENYSFVEDVETALELENWMFNEVTPKMANIDYEPELTVESWMIS
ncbi:MAG: hypothetical protein JXR31_14770 [Prolixibacteraceae bacterium]|nr:hypothetical protein [Prolixibacteraceae bacterium]